MWLIVKIEMYTNKSSIGRRMKNIDYRRKFSIMSSLTAGDTPYR